MSNLKYNFHLNLTLFRDIPFTGKVKLSATTSPNLPTWYTRIVAAGAISADRVTANVQMVDACVTSWPVNNIIPFESKI
jgi:hypothetical protein